MYTEVHVRHFAKSEPIWIEGILHAIAVNRSALSNMYALGMDG